MNIDTLRLLAWIVLAAVPPAVLADVGNETKSAAGLRVDLGIVPAETIRNRPEEYAELKMHGGVPSGRSMYHVMVAIFDASTGVRITDAQVRARVEEVGLTSEDKKLEPMRIAGALTYGNFFHMAGQGAFRITVQIRRPGATRAIEMQFEHRHR